MNKAEAREILKERIFYGDKQEDLKIIDKAIDYLLTLEEVVRCMDCVHYTNPEIGWCEYHSRTQAVDGSEWTLLPLIRRIDSKMRTDNLSVTRTTTSVTLIQTRPERPAHPFGGERRQDPQIRAVHRSSSR